MDSFAKRTELAGRRALVRLFRMVRPRRDSAVPLPINATGKRILMLRQDRIGDVLVSLPVIHAIKQHFPTARIDALFGVNNHFVAPGDAAFSTRFVYRKEPGEIATLLRTLRRNKYDVLIDFMDNVSASSTMLVSAIGAHCAIGIDKENAYAYDVVVPRLPQGSVHIVDRLGELLRPFGIDPAQEDLRLRYALPAEADRRARDWMAALGDSPKIGVNISASGGSKMWAEEKFVDAIRRITHDHPSVEIVLFCAPGEESRAQAIADAVNAAVFPPGSFDEFAAGIKHCNALITVDTSAVHLAAAFRVPAVVLFVHDKPELMPWVPYRTPHRAVVTTEHTIANIPVDAVVAAFNALDAECTICAGARPVTA